MPSTHNFILIAAAALLTFTSCSKHEKKQEEQLVVSPETEPENDNDSLLNTIAGNITMKQVRTFPNRVILTGMKDHRLVSVYRSQTTKSSEKRIWSSSGDYNGIDESEQLFMPGIDMLYGYNLLNVGHYDMQTGQSNYFFSKPVLIKTVYYPSVIQDSLHKQPVNRNYYLISVYDKDTNRDSLINRKDLRHFYHFDANATTIVPLVPTDYSVLRSQYDTQNDAMFIFARHDANKNGTQDVEEPIHIFWIDLKAPAKAKRMY